MADDKKESLSTIKDLAKYLHLSESTIYELTKKGKIPSIKIGGAWRFKPEDIEKWLDKKKKGNK